MAGLPHFFFLQLDSPTHVTVLVSRAISVSYISQRLKGKEKKRSSDIISWKQPGSRPRSVTLVWRAEQNVPFNGQTGTKGKNLKRLNHECLLLFSRGGTINERSERTELFLVYFSSFSENVMSREQVWPWNRGARQSELQSCLKLQCPQMSNRLLGVEWSISASAEYSGLFLQHGARAPVKQWDGGLPEWEHTCLWSQDLSFWKEVKNG